MYRFVKKLSVLLLAGAMVSAAFCTEDAPTHECTSWMLSPDSFDSGKECLIELVVVNPARRKTAVFRIGTGEDKFDRFMEF